MTGQPEMRIGDAERDAAVTALGEHYAAGRLTKDEYDERAEQAFAARTSSALWPLFADLPRGQAPRAEASRPSASSAAGGRPRAFGPSGRHPGWWAGAWMAPLLVVVLVLVVLTHLPWFVLVLIVWLAWAKLFRHWGRRHDDHSQRGPSSGGWAR